MAMQIGKAEGVRAEINVTPLIDVVLVLLIIFMVVTPMLQRGYAVLLPEGRDPQKKPDDRNDVIISIEANGQLHWQTDVVTEGILDQNLRDLYDRAPSNPLFIKADRRVKYGEVKKTMLRCEAAGFKSVNLVTEQVRGGPQ